MDEGFFELAVDAELFQGGGLTAKRCNKDALFGKCLDRYASIHGAQYEQALAAHLRDPVRAVEAFFDVILGRIADPSVAVGCLIAQPAAQSLTLKEENSVQVRGLLGIQRQRVHPALADSSADSRQPTAERSTSSPLLSSLSTSRWPY
ncbi:hypothetical protein [Streptomyces mirabilis]|uniref:hypothetical protein n=1 Tax=Streptomyces mirabilis TaxID=68239 RepID=UPI00364C459C